MNKRSALTVCAAATLGLATLGTAGLAAGAAASGAHAVTTASKSNYSSAVERPTWNLSCNSSTKTFTFTINNVQVIDASGKPWNHNNGPWTVTFWAATQAGPVPFSRYATLHQNTTNGLFTGKVSATAKNAATWCQTGASVSVVGFSGGDEPLLLDGTLS